MKVENKIRKLLDQNRDLFDQSSYDEAIGYLECGECEMAYEGLLIELVKLDGYHPEGFDFELWKSVGEACELDSNGGVFDYEIWSKFLKWGEQG